MKCRSCKAELTRPVLDLGFAPPSNSYLTVKQLNEPETYLPLRVRFCEQCTLVQLEDYSHPRHLFTSDYAYRSGVSKTWMNHVTSFANDIINRIGLDERSLVLEIGCNDGHLLHQFASFGISCLGIEPATEAAKVGRLQGLEIIGNFFSGRMARNLAADGIRADLVVANNVFAHVPDPLDFAEGLRAITQPDGIITLEFPHVLNLVRYSQFDTIYHEHFSYLSLTSVSHVLQRAGLQVFDVEQLTTHGGSLRVYATPNGRRETPTSRVKELLGSEFNEGLLTRATYAGLQPKAEGIKNALLSFLLDAKRTGKRVAAYGAAAKGNTLLNFAGIKPDLLPVIYDAAPSKQNKFLPGSHIPIRNPSSIDGSEYDYLLILPWNIAEEIANQLSALKANGVTFFIAVPELTMLP